MTMTEYDLWTLGCRIAQATLPARARLGRPLPPPRPSRGPPAGATWVAFNGDDEAEAGPAVFGNPGFFSVFSSHCFFQSACRDMGLAPSGLILSDKPGLALPT